MLSARVATFVSVVIAIVMFAFALRFEGTQRSFTLLLVGWLTADTVERFSRAWFRRP